MSRIGKKIIRGLRKFNDSLKRGEDVSKRLYLLQKIDGAEQEIAASKGLPHEEVRRRLAKWLT